MSKLPDPLGCWFLLAVREFTATPCAAPAGTGSRSPWCRRSGRKRGGACGPSPDFPSTLVGTSEAHSPLSGRPRAGHTALLALARWLQRRRHASPDTAPPDLAPAADRPAPPAGGPGRPDGPAPARSRPRGAAG